MEGRFLDLPFAIQIALGTGYLAYLVAYAGIRQHHTSLDAFFRTLAFGLPASSIIYFAEPGPLTIAGAVVVSLLLAVVWRWRGMAVAKYILRASEISWTDDLPTAWISLVAEDTRARPSQIAVDLSDGRTLTCDDTRLFADAPHGPCKFGLDGSIAMYVTAERRTDGEWIEHQNVRDPVDGDRVTYIPAASILRAEIRLWSRGIGKAVTGEERAVVSEEGQAAKEA